MKSNLGTDRDHELHEAAILFSLAASTPAEEAYFIGYTSGISKRMAGGIGQDGTEALAFELMQDAADEATRTLGRGYRDGLAGEPLKLIPFEYRFSHSGRDHG